MSGPAEFLQGIEDSENPALAPVKTLARVLLDDLSNRLWHEYTQKLKAMLLLSKREQVAEHISKETVFTRLIQPVSADLDPVFVLSVLWEVASIESPDVFVANGNLFTEGSIVAKMHGYLCKAVLAPPVSGPLSEELLQLSQEVPKENSDVLTLVFYYMLSSVYFRLNRGNPEDLCSPPSEYARRIYSQQLMHYCREFLSFSKICSFSTLGVLVTRNYENTYWRLQCLSDHLFFLPHTEAPFAERSDEFKSCVPFYALAEAVVNGEIDRVVQLLDTFSVSETEEDIVMTNVRLHAFLLYCKMKRSVGLQELVEALKLGPSGLPELTRLVVTLVGRGVLRARIDQINDVLLIEEVGVTKVSREDLIDFFQKWKSALDKIDL